MASQAGKRSVTRQGKRSLRLWPFNRKQTVSRRFERYPCCVVAVMHLTDRGYDIDGVVLEVSEGGVLFRTASQFVMDRQGERVIVFFDTVETAGTVVNVRAHGYGIKLDEQLDVMDVRRIAALYNHDQAKRSGFSNQEAPERDTPAETAA